jgi:hypothetical protein
MIAWGSHVVACFWQYGLLLQYVAFSHFTLEISKPSGKTRNHGSHSAPYSLSEGWQQLHFLTVATAAFRYKVASIGSTETTKDGVDRIWVLLIWFYAPKAFGGENVGSVMSKLKDEFAAFLGVGETEQRTLAALTLDKRLHKCPLV